MEIFTNIFKFLGGVAFVLYGMKTMSGGMQKCAGRFLKKSILLMQKNDFCGFFVGIAVSALIQSSAASVQAAISFTNAGLLSVSQALPVIFGANVGTTVTAWLVSCFVSVQDFLIFALPIFAFGYILSFFKKENFRGLGEVLLGFSLLFVGLNWIGVSLQEGEGARSILQKLCYFGWASIFLGFAISFFATALLNSSSAMCAISIILVANNFIDRSFAASLVIGSEIGSTFNVVHKATKDKLDGQRVAFCHAFFNFVIAIFALVFFSELLHFVDFLIPENSKNSSGFFIATIHTFLKIAGCVISFPLKKILLLICQKILKEKKSSLQKRYFLEIPKSFGVKENASAYIVRCEKEISDMANLALSMFARVKKSILSIQNSSEKQNSFSKSDFDFILNCEDFMDQMKEWLSRYIVALFSLPLNDDQLRELSQMQITVNELEDLSDACFTIALLLKRIDEKKLCFDPQDIARFDSYTKLTQDFLHFTIQNIHKKISEEDFEKAKKMEDEIDFQKDELKRLARKRLENGANARAELLYIDLVRQIEKIGDTAFSISQALV